MLTVRRGGISKPKGVLARGKHGAAGTKDTLSLLRPSPESNGISPVPVYNTRGLRKEAATPPIIAVTQEVTFKSGQRKHPVRKRSANIMDSVENGRQTRADSGIKKRNGKALYGEADGSQGQYAEGGRPSKKNGKAPYGEADGSQGQYAEGGRPSKKKGRAPYGEADGSQGQNAEGERPSKLTKRSRVQPAGNDEASEVENARRTVQEQEIVRLKARLAVFEPAVTVDTP